MLKDEYERGYDWFHQSESLMLLYFLCMAAPERWRERAIRFAELYVDPTHGNYDPEHRIITRPHTGSDPTRTGLFDGPNYPWLPKEADMYGFPLDWLLPPDTPEPERAQDPRLSTEMLRRIGVGDSAVNLAITGLVHNALILTGEQRYRDWITQYVGAWRQRAPPTTASSPTTSPPTAPSAACWRDAGTAHTTAGPGPTAGTASDTPPPSPHWPQPPPPATTPT